MEKTLGNKKDDIFLSRDSGEQRDELQGKKVSKGGEKGLTEGILGTGRKNAFQDFVYGIEYRKVAAPWGEYGLGMTLLEKKSPSILSFCRGLHRSRQIPQDVWYLGKGAWWNKKKKTPIKCVVGGRSLRVLFLGGATGKEKVFQTVQW